MIKDFRDMKIIIAVIIICFVGYFVYLMGAFNIFEETNDKLKIINVKGKNYKIVLYRINGNATVQNGIQVRKLTGLEETTLKHYSRYDSLVSYSLHENYLKLVLKNNSISEKKTDTLYLKFP